MDRRDRPQPANLLAVILFSAKDRVIFIGAVTITIAVAVINRARTIPPLEDDEPAAQDGSVRAMEDVDRRVEQHTASTEQDGRMGGRRTCRAGRIGTSNGRRR